MYDLILKKRNGGELTLEEINYFVTGYMADQIPDYQVAALLMAIYFRGMNSRETADLTLAMVNSGEKIQLAGIPGIKVDKHSTGGVGDKTTLVLAPLVAAAGVPVAKMSGRALGHTGGTIDKLESIPGFYVDLEPDVFIRQIQDINIALTAQTGKVAPADKKLYALRDVTATVDSIPLIASSIVSKKIASGADAILLDVKCGNGAFMQTREEAVALARAMVDIGRPLGRRMAAVVTDMNGPLGQAVGNALEVREALDTLRGQGPDDLKELCLTLGTHMLVLGGKTENVDAARHLLEGLLDSGRALEKFKALVEFQGGDPAVADNPGALPSARYQYEVTAPSGGYVTTIDTLQVGRVAMLLGAGRVTKEEPIDHAAGVLIMKKPGEPVCKGETLAVLHTNSRSTLEGCAGLIVAAYSLGRTPPPEQPLILETIF